MRSFGKSLVISVIMQYACDVLYVCQPSKLVVILTSTFLMVVFIVGAFLAVTLLSVAPPVRDQGCAF